MDPGLSQKILRLVNSAGYGLRIRCTSLGHATALLGQTKLRQVATSAVLFDHFGKASNITRKKQEHGALVASLCRYLAIHLGLPQDDLFTIGLLHDIGQLMMLDDDLKGYEQMLMTEEGQFDALHQRERSLLGFDHAILAGHVLGSWSIPAPVPEVIALHHQPARAHQAGLDVAAMVQTLRFADHLSHLLEHKRSKLAIPELAESEAASYLDFSEIQIASMWRDLEKVHEVTKNRRFNIIDVAPRSVEVPNSLRPRMVPFSIHSRADSVAPGDENPRSRRHASSEADRISIPAYVSPHTLLTVKASDVVGMLSERADNDAAPEPDVQASASSAEFHEEAAPVPEPRLGWRNRPPEMPAEMPLEAAALERPASTMFTASVADPSPPSPKWNETTQVDGLVFRADALRPAADPDSGPELERFRHDDPLPHHLLDADQAPIEQNPDGTTDWFARETRDDISPEVFPCAFCYAPTFGATCQVCSAQVCAQHQFAARQWCVACEDEFQDFVHKHPVNPVVPLSLAVSLAVASLATWYFYSLDGALGVLSMGVVIGFVGYVWHHARTKRNFRHFRRNSVDDGPVERPDVRLEPRHQEASASADPTSDVLETIGRDGEADPEREDQHVQASPFSMPVPAPRAGGFMLDPICEPPRPSLLNFHRPDQSGARFDSLFAPADTRTDESAPLQPTNGQAFLATQDSRSNNTFISSEAATSSDDPTLAQGAPATEASPSLPQIPAMPAPVSMVSLSQTGLNSPTLPAPSNDPVDLGRHGAEEAASARALERNEEPDIVPLRVSLRTLPPSASLDDGDETASARGETEAVGFTAPVCEPVRAAARIELRAPRLSSTYCTGYPPGRVAITALEP